MRSFFAFEISDAVKNELELLLKSIKRLPLPIRWIDIENIHITLLFIEDIDQNIVETLKPKIEPICLKTKSFKLVVENGGFFGTKTYPKILWAGISGLPEDVAVLKNAVEKQFEPFGITQEEKLFKPHLTLGRFKNRSDEKTVIKCLVELQKFKSSTFNVNELMFFKSDLTPNGSIYTKISTFKLSE